MKTRAFLDAQFSKGKNTIVVLKTNNKEVLNHVVKNPKHFEFQTTKIFKEVFNNVFKNQHHFNR